MTPRFRKLTLTTHITTSVGLIGGVAVFLVLAIAGLASKDTLVARAAYLAMELTAWFVIVPLAFASLLIGIMESLGTRWGLFRHYWVLVKLLLTLVATVVLLLQMELIRYLAAAAEGTTAFSPNLSEPRMSLVAHAGGGLLVLLVIATLSVYKPRGRTRYGLRKLREQRTAAAQ